MTSSRLRLIPCVITLFLGWVGSVLPPDAEGQDVPSREPIPDGLVVLCFDDGNKSDRALVAGVLEEHGFKATFYVTEGLGFLTSKAHYTSWPEIRELHDMGFEIGNHTRHHRHVPGLSAEELEDSLSFIDARCAAHGIPKPVTFAYPGFAHSAGALPVLEKHGIVFARRGVRPEFQDGGQGGRGPVYDPAIHHPLLIPTTWYAGPESGSEDLSWAVEQAVDGKIAVLCYHGVPALEHPWVSLEPDVFREQMEFLDESGCTVIALRDLQRYIDPQWGGGGDSYAPIRERTPVKIGSRRELFVDRALVEDIQGDAELQVQQPSPEEVVLVTDQPWEGNTSAYYTLFQDEDRYRMYYRGSHWDETLEKAAHREVTCYAESHDGIHWEKPSLGLYSFQGSRENNIVWDGIGTHCFTVFKDTRPGCAPEARYKAISRGRPLGEKGLYVYQSADGLHWSLLAEGPVITEGAFDSQNLAFWDAGSQVYRAFYRVFQNGVRAIMTSTSEDFVHWKEPVLLTHGEAPPQHLYTNAVMPYGRAPHLLLGFPTRFLPEEGERVEPTFMASRDGGRSFTRWLDAVIPESAPWQRDGNRSNYMAWGMFALPNHPGELSVYATEGYYEGPDSRLRRFAYRVDGFVALRAGEEGGELLTTRIAFEGERLSVNVAAREGGSLRVELQDSDGVPLEGYALADCEPLTGDSHDAEVSWRDRGTADLAAVAGQPIRVRFVLRDGDLFAYQFLQGDD